jgi:hypothetical protein
MGARGMAQTVEHLPSKCKALSSNTRTAKQTNENKQSSYRDYRNENMLLI